MRLLPLRIAYRYLTGKKSHSAVNIIALVSIAGVAVATAAIICVLSVFNGFKDVLGEKFDTLAPDIVVEQKEGTPFGGTDELCRKIASLPEVASASPSLTDQALVVVGNRETPVMLKGIDPLTFRRNTLIDSLSIAGSSPLEPAPGEEERELTGKLPGILLSLGIAIQVSALEPGQPLMAFVPKREGRINPANPAASLISDSLEIRGIYQTKQAQYDETMAIADITTVRELLQYDEDQATSIEVTLKSGADPSSAEKKISKAIGTGFDVKDRMKQHEMNFRMVEIEKWITFLLLFFILIIASFNIISSLSLLVLEKQDSLAILSALGMRRCEIGSVFGWESALVTIAGAVAGILLGVGAVLLQEHYGLLRLNGDPETLMMASYPVRLLWSDLLWTLLPIGIIGAATALITGKFAKNRIGLKNN